MIIIQQKIKQAKQTNKQTKKHIYLLWLTYQIRSDM